MIRKNTVLVLGAGASAPYGFPTAEGLKRLIATDTNAGAIDKLITQTCQFSGAPIDTRRLPRFRETFLEAGVSSIDSYLAQLPENEQLIGKMLIAAYILDAEHKSLNWRQFERNLLYTESDWIVKLFELMDRDTNSGTFADNAVGVVTFNYDRSFEHKLFLHLAHKFALPESTCCDVMQRIPVVHIYGQIGYVHVPNGVGEIGYGLSAEHWSNILLKCANSVRIVHETTLDEETHLKEAQALLAVAERVIFLGFGYDQLNLKRILPDQKAVNSLWFGSAKGLTEGERGKARGEIAHHVKGLTTLGGNARTDGREPDSFWMAGEDDDCLMTLRKIVHVLG